MTEFNLLKLDGKPIEKLIKSIHSAIGTLYEPRSIRKNADAMAYKISVIEGAKSNAWVEKKELKHEALSRIEQRIIYQEINRQKNIDFTVYSAAENLKNEKEISEDPVNPDWSTRFFNIIQDISNEDVQKLWGKILADEVKNPNSYSIRTIELLKNLSKEDLMCFEKAADFAISFFDSNNTSFIFKGFEDILSQNYEFIYGDFLKLFELGILQQIDSKYTFGQITSNTLLEQNFIMGNKVVKIDLSSSESTLIIPAYNFTQVGIELLNLAKRNPPGVYFDFFLNNIKNDSITIMTANIIDKNMDGSYKTTPYIKY